MPLFPLGATLAMGRAGPGLQKPGPAHLLVGPAHKSPARPTGPRARANLYYILTKMLLLTQTIR